MLFLDNVSSNTPKEFLHSWYLLITSGLALIFLLISSNWALNGLMSFIIYTLLLKNNLKWLTFFKLLFYSLTFSSFFFFLNLAYNNVASKTGLSYQIVFLNFHFTLYEGSLLNASNIFFRLFFLTLVSMGSSHVINYTKVILYLIIHWGLKVFWGYPLLIALNSILLFKDEYKRIQDSAKFRRLPWSERVFLFFPLLVFAIRHSQRGSLSLVTRGLSPHKSFYFSYDISFRDRLVLAIFGMAYVCLVAIGFYFR